MHPQEGRPGFSDRIPISIEFIEGGWNLKGRSIAKMIEDKIDILHVSAGMRADLSKVQFMMAHVFAHMFNVHFAEQFRKELSLPITTVGSIMTLEWNDFVKQLG